MSLFTLSKRMNSTLGKALIYLELESNNNSNDTANNNHHKALSASTLAQDAVHIKFLASPINPADINQIEGTYPLKPEQFPAVGGNEGVAKVVSLGSNVSEFNIGDWVIPSLPGLGTWREEMICHQNQIMKIPNNLPLEAAATLLVNPCTAFRMLHDFKSLVPGDLIIHNAANSAVGLAVIQLCKLMGVDTISVIRDRPNFEKLEAKLRVLGTSMVIKSDRLPLPETQAHIQAVFGKKPSFGLNAVGGQSALDIANSLSKGSSLVTYGAMSRKALLIPAGLLIFSNIKFKGFWISDWYTTQTEAKLRGQLELTHERDRMMNELISLVQAGKLVCPEFEKHSLESFRDALVSNQQSTNKHLLIF